jgi:cytidylate kinase
MNETVELGKCLSYIDCQLKHQEGAFTISPPGAKPPSITISRQTGAGGRPIADKLAAYLAAHSTGEESGPPWTVFDANLIKRVLADHNLPKRLAQYLPEDRSSMLDDILEELLGLHPPSWTIVHQTTETILRLAEMGHAIMVGRGANVITCRLENVFHVRLVASEETRLERVAKVYQKPGQAGVDFMRQEEAGRARYLKKYFGKDINDPLLYHLVLNTDRFTHDEAARLIGETVRARFVAPSRMEFSAK